MAMKLKTTTIEGKVYAEVQDGKPVFIHDDGKEIPFDAEAATATITDRRKKAQEFENQVTELTGKLKVFEKIDDPEAALKALETVKNIEDGQLIAAGKVEEIKAAARRAAEEQVAAANKAHAEKLSAAETERDKLQAQLYGEKIGGSFARSKFVSDRLVLPGPAAQKVFGDNFKMEEGKPVAYDHNGNKIFSRAKPGELADFEEALEILVDNYPYRDSLLKGTGGGTGARGGNGAVAGQRTMTRAEFDALPFDQRATKIKEVKIVD